MVSNAIAPASKKRPLPGGKKDDTSCVVAEVIEWTKEARLCPFLIPDLVNFCRGFAEAPVGSMLEKYGTNGFSWEIPDIAIAILGDGIWSPKQPSIQQPAIVP